MDSLLKSDIFFVITSIAVVFLTILFAVILMYLIIIMKNVTALSKKIKEEGSEIIDDARVMRREIKSKAGKMSALLSLIPERIIRRYKNKKRNQDE